MKFYDVPITRYQELYASPIGLNESVRSSGDYCKSLMTFRRLGSRGAPDARHWPSSPQVTAQIEPTLRYGCILRRRKRLSNFLKYGFHGDAKSDARAFSGACAEPILGHD